MILRNFHFVVFISIALVGLSVLAMALVDRYLPDVPEPETGPTVAIGSLSPPPIAGSIRFFGTTEEDAPLVIHPDGRVLRYGRDLGTDPEIFEALQRALFEGCPPSKKD